MQELPSKKVWMSMTLHQEWLSSLTDTMISFMKLQSLELQDKFGLE